MATRNIYVKLSKSLQGKEAIIKNLLFAVWLGGFILLFVLSQLTGNPKIIIEVGGKIWFSVCVIFGVLYMVVTGFNPERDPAEKSAKESWAVFMLNVAVFMAVYVWFMEN